MRDAVIVSAVRTAVGKAPKGTLRDTRPDEMGAAVIEEAIARSGGVEKSEVEDVIMGCAMPEAEQGMNVARAAAVRAGLPVESSAMTINRFCSSGLQSIAIAADRIRTGSAETIVAGGLETMSMIPMGGHIIRPNPYLVEHYPDFYLNMGLATENVAAKYGVSRDEQDRFALQSHQRAAAAQDAGKFDDEIVPLKVAFEDLDAKGKKVRREVAFTRDEGVRRDTSEESLAKLKPAFHAKGTITAGNASQMSDGAAAVVVVSEDRARQLGVRPMARFVAYATAGCPPEEMGIGPVHAIPKVLRLAGLKLEDIDVIELNEAFAAQSLAVIRQLGLDPERVNVNGGAIALGHPLGCTGAKLTATILRELERRQGRYGMVTMCVGGGMGAAGIFERIA
ncbi:MAG TPA: acetyl-CoA C-acyltransferase [Pyrinomonadaceae bacterium]|jgi:acetyl-CoA acyltransferase|nr:acetyl-CoA C-acyltransferase [Pyrinomonadaceae bacterium]